MSGLLNTEAVLQHLLEHSSVAQRLRVEGQCRGTSDLREIVAVVLDLANDQHDASQQLIRQLTEALTTIAAFDDEYANRKLEQTGSYFWFDEPGAVQTAREALHVAGKDAGVSST